MQMWRGPRQQAPLTWTGPAAAIKVRCVCEVCNNGWMSMLEGLAKPIVGPLVADLSFDLRWTDQTLIAFWLIKTAMVFEAVKTGTPMFFTDQDRAHLLSAFSPPLEATMWIGRYAQHVGGYGEGRHLKKSIALPPYSHSPLSEGYVNTFAFGHLVMQVICIRREPGAHVPNVTLHSRKGNWSKLLRQVWPIRNQRITWPPPLSFSDHGVTLDELGERFTGTPPKWEP